MQRYNLPGFQVSPEAKNWAKSDYLPRVPKLQEIVTVGDPLVTQYPIPENPSNEITELTELSYLRDNSSKLISIQQGRLRRPISRFLQLRPQPYGAIYNKTTPENQPVIQTGRELARWFESETPGLAHRQALNYLLPKTSLTPPHQARIWATLDISIYASLLAAWHYKWEEPSTSYRPRPIEVAPSLNVLYNYAIDATGNGDGEMRISPQPSPGTPRHPSYPSGHSTVGGAASELLSYFFPDLRSDFDDLADNAGLARLWAGIHYRSDHEFGMALGRAIAGLVISNLRQDGIDLPVEIMGARLSLF
jgi:PAP2 superfamily